MPTDLDFENRRLLNAVVGSKSWLPLRAKDAPFVKTQVITVSGKLWDDSPCVWTGTVRAEDDGRYTVFVEMTCAKGREKSKVRIVPTASVSSAEIYPTVTVDATQASQVLVNIYEE